MIKAAFFDIDGTLLSFKTHLVSPGTIQAFEELHRQAYAHSFPPADPKCSSRLCPLGLTAMSP